MATSSISIKNSSSNSEEHMRRDNYISYLLEHSSLKYVYRSFSDSNEYLKYAKKMTKKLTNRSMQKTAINGFVKEAVINIKDTTTIQDIQKLFKELNRQFTGFKIFKIALHKDEGVFVDTAHNLNDLEFDTKSVKWFKNDVDVSDDVYVYAPAQNIFYDEKTKLWYEDIECTKVIDTSKFQKLYNLHAHVLFTKWEESTGKNARIQKSDLSRIQDITAKVLKMERGEKWSSRISMSHRQLKEKYMVVNTRKKLKVSEETKNSSADGWIEQKKKLKEELEKAMLTIKKLNLIQQELKNTIAEQKKLLEIAKIDKTELPTQLEIVKKINDTLSDNGDYIGAIEKKILQEKDKNNSVESSKSNNSCMDEEDDISFKEWEKCVNKANKVLLKNTDRTQKM